MNKRLLSAIVIALLSVISMSAETTVPTYSANSVLANGKWAKIRVAETGITRLTPDVIRKAGFSDLSKVKIYGYGGAMIPEKLTQDWLAAHDDLKEIPSCANGDSKYFYAVGTVDWANTTTTARVRNPYSTHGYYFITEDGTSPASCTESDLLSTYTNSPAAYHYLYEQEKFSFSQLGRNLVDSKEIASGAEEEFLAIIPGGNTKATIQISLAAGAAASCRVTCDKSSSNVTFSFGNYTKQKISTNSFTVSNVNDYLSNDGNAYYPVTVRNTGTSPIRLDYITAVFSTPRSAAPLSGNNYPSAEYVENVANQNHHADELVDLTIIIPASGELYKSAEKLAEHHRNFDGMSVRIVNAKELYNEFSSGTPDVSAYKRYMKMFYDRGAMDQMTTRPSVLLFGDAIWDNRAIALSSSTITQDRYLLGFQTENSETLVNSIISDDFITVLQDDMTIHADGNTGEARKLHFDIGVGRLPVTTSDVANAVVEKIINYTTKSPAGIWQNEIMFIGDDGDSNSHMRNINKNADAVITNSPGYNVKKVMADAYELKSTSVGNAFPEVTNVVLKQQNNGALVMNYGGHASWLELSHEKILTLSDFSRFHGTNYSLWFTAACETMPFDQTYPTMGELALLNAEGGAIAFYGTVRTVYETQNSNINMAFMKHLLSYDEEGTPLTLGEVQRRAKNAMVERDAIPYKQNGKTLFDNVYDFSINKHQYHLLGDPAMRLAIPRNKAVIDKINDNESESAELVEGNSIVTVSGHIEDRHGNINTTFNGTANLLIRDSERTITCRDNDNTGDPFKFNDRISTLFRGSCTVVDGMFTCTFRIPSDIYNDGGCGLITIYARDNINKISANGETDRFSAQGWQEATNDKNGPSIYGYLNDTSFRNGGEVGTTPFFVAEISDKDGINATGTSLGHNMTLTIDGETAETMDVTDNFIFDNNSYTSGRTYTVLEAQAPGRHTLEFKAWDLLNNSSTLRLDFTVNKTKQPNLVDINVWPLIIKDAATFKITHDMRGTNAHICIDIISTSGSLVQTLEWNDELSKKEYSLNDGISENYGVTSYRWTPSGLSRGFYLYRVRLSCNGSEYVSKTKKLCITQ